MNINDPILGAGLGVIIALILAFPTLFSELSRKFGGGRHFLLPDVHSWHGRKLKDRETLAIGLLIHLIAGLVYGGLYPVLIKLGAWSGNEYSASSFAVYTIGAYLFLGLVVFPLLGFGLFGYKEDRWMWVETAFATLLVAIMYAFAIGWFQPLWFNVL